MLIPHILGITVDDTHMYNVPDISGLIVLGAGAGVGLSLRNIGTVLTPVADQVAKTRLFLRCTTFSSSHFSPIFHRSAIFVNFLKKQV